MRGKLHTPEVLSTIIRDNLPHSVYLSLTLLPLFIYAFLSLSTLSAMSFGLFLGSPSPRLNPHGYCLFDMQNRQLYVT